MINVKRKWYCGCDTSLYLCQYVFSLRECDIWWTTNKSHGWADIYDPLAFHTRVCVCVCCCGCVCVCDCVWYLMSTCIILSAPCALLHRALTWFSMNMFDWGLLDSRGVVYANIYHLPSLPCRWQSGWWTTASPGEQTKMAGNTLPTSLCTL